MAKKKHYRVVGYDGVPCPRCGRPTQIREHPHIGEKQLRQPFYYSRWFNCINNKCKTTLYMLDEYKVFNHLPAVEEPEESPEVLQRTEAIFEQLDERPPWE